MMYCASCICGFNENRSYFELDGCLYLIPTPVKEHIDEIEKKLQEYIYRDWE